MSPAAPVEVGRLEDFVEGRMRRVRVGRHTVGLLAWGGRVYAFADRCPHMGAPMCDGRVLHRIDAREDGELERDTAAGPLVACPWHGWEFAVASGRAVVDPRQRVRTYRVDIDADGHVLVDVTQHAEGARRAKEAA